MLIEEFYRKKGKYLPYNVVLLIIFATSIFSQYEIDIPDKKTRYQSIKPIVTSNLSEMIILDLTDLKSF